MKNIKFNRKELYNLVWAEPMVSLSKKYSISDNGLRKICKKMNIPFPKNGHWQKLRYGKHLSIVALPSEYSGKDEVILSLREEGSKNNIRHPSPVEILQKEIESIPDLPLIVPEKLFATDKLVVAVKTTLTNQKPDTFQYKGMVHSTRGELDIKVSSENIGRALRFMDTFIKLLRARGHNAIADDNAAYAIVSEEKIEISLKELTKRIKVKSGILSWETTEYHPTGILSFRAGVFHGNSVWADGKVLIETRLSNILAQLEISSKERKEQRLRWKKEEEEREKKEQIKRELEQRKENELADFKGLLKEAHRWRQVELLRDYINAVEAKANANDSLSEELKEWLTWAHKKTDWYDPYIAAEDELLKEVDRDNLAFKQKKSSFY